MSNFVCAWAKRSSFAFCGCFAAFSWLRRRFNCAQRSFCENLHERSFSDAKMQLLGRDKTQLFCSSLTQLFCSSLRQLLRCLTQPKIWLFKSNSERVFANVCSYTVYKERMFVFGINYSAKINYRNSCRWKNIPYIVEQINLHTICSGICQLCRKN